MRTYSDIIISIIRARKIGTSLVENAAQAAIAECTQSDSVKANAAAQSLVSGLNKLAQAGLASDAKAIVTLITGRVPFVITLGKEGYRKGKDDVKHLMSAKELAEAEQAKLVSAKKRADAASKNAEERRTKLERFPVLEERVQTLQTDNLKLKLANNQLEDKLLQKSREFNDLQRSHSELEHAAMSHASFVEKSYRDYRELEQEVHALTSAKEALEQELAALRASISAEKPKRTRKAA